jgi:hypothetical protein
MTTYSWFEFQNEGYTSGMSWYTTKTVRIDLTYDGWKQLKKEFKQYVEDHKGFKCRMIKLTTVIEVIREEEICE